MAKTKEQLQTEADAEIESAKPLYKQVNNERMEFDESDYAQAKIDLGNANWRTKPHMPPLQPIEDWATKRDLNTWGVVKSINERGTPLVPFLLLAEKNTRKARRKLTKKAQKQIALSWKMKR